MDRNLYYFNKNKLILKYAPVLVFALCLFWIILDVVTHDSMYFFASYAIYGVYAMMIISVIQFSFILYLDRIISNEKSGLQTVEFALVMWRVVSLFFYITLIISAAVVIAADNYAVSLEGTESTLQSISLVSTLLVIIIIIPLPSARDGIVLFVLSVLSLIIPFFMPGSDVYTILPELVYRASLAVAYFVIRRRTDINYNLEKDILSGNGKIMALLVDLIEMRDMESGLHVNVVKDYCKIMLEKLMEKYPEYELTPSKIEKIAEASTTHDIGKIMIADNILMKPGKLTDEEYNEMKTHTSKGYQILNEVPEELLGSEYLKYAKDICLHHHEKYDGKGYPTGLKGEDIPVWAQVVSVVDCYEALTSDRCYKKAFTHEQAIQMICDGECGAFSDKMIECLKACSDDLKAYLMKKNSVIDSTK